MKVGKFSTIRSKALAGFAVLIVLASSFCQAECESEQYFDIPQQKLDAALLNFAQQAQISAIFPGREYNHIQTNRVQGYYCKEDALEVLLEGLDIEGGIDDANQLIVRFKSATNASGAVAGVDGLTSELSSSKKNKVSRFLSQLFLGDKAKETPVKQSQIFRAPALEEIMVTGSRITRTGMESPTPVTSLNSDQLNVLSPDILIEAMTLLPQFYSSSSPETIRSASGSLGSSFLNLRGIGSKRTLVLLDGRRVAPSNRLGTPDIATFPQAIISNVEIVTGGASAAYGSDAVSGVVNYTLDTDYSGFKGYVQFGETSRGDNERTGWSFTLGRDIGDRSHLLFTTDYFVADKVETYEQRDWFKNWGTVDVNGRNSPKVVAADVRSRLYTAGGLIRLPGSALDMIHFVEGGQSAPFEDGTLIGETRQVGGTGFWGDIGSKEEDQTGQGSLYPDTERGSAFLYLDYDFNSEYTGFAQALYGINNIDYLGSGAHQESSAWRATIFQDNAFLPESIRQIMMAEGLDDFPLYRYSSSADLARARGIQENQTKSIVLGLKGSDKDLRINAYYQYSNNNNTFSTQDFPRLDRMYKAMDAVVDPATTDVVCRSTLMFPGDGCIPANPFGPGMMSNAAIEYILDGDMYRESDLSQHVAELTLDTEVFDERAQGPISVVVGLTYRKETFKQAFGPQNLVDLNVLPEAEEGYQGLPSGFVGSGILQFAGVSDVPIQGTFNVRELFVESSAPIVSDVLFIQSLDLSTSVRYADYSGSGGVYAWKAGLDWRLNDAFRFRFARSRDIRASTLAERFDRSSGGATAFDPVIGETYSFGQILGGNSQVDPEHADSWTAGLVYRPMSMPNLSLSADWYNVKVDGYISLLGTQKIISDCSDGVMELCAQITRDPLTNRIQSVSNVYLNAAQARVRGADIEMSYNSTVSLFTTDNEEVGLRLFTSYLNENSFTNIGEETLDKAGTVSLPELSATAMLNYRLDSYTLSFVGRYIGETAQFVGPVSLSNQLDKNDVDPVFYLNMNLNYEFRTANNSRYSIYMNVSNLLDEDPPIVATWRHFFGASAFVPGLHDSLGRRYTLGVSFEF